MTTLAQDITNVLAKELGPKLKNFLAIYDYGSTVYGYKEPTDRDFIVVIKVDHNIHKSDFHQQLDVLGYDVTVVNDGMFMNMLNRHEITQIECINLPENKIQYIDPLWKEQTDKFVVDKGKLRCGISMKANNSYVKAKKKLVVFEDYDLTCSIKSLWHSFRILDFGTQLAEHGKITDFTSMNYLYPVIVELYDMYNNDWDKIHADAKPIHNAAASKFKLLAPKA